MKSRTVAMFLAALMCVASVAGYAARPEVVRGRHIFLEARVPAKFGEWSQETRTIAQVINPQTQGTLNGIYDELLSRVYVHKDGYRIMLSIAYGGDQRGVLAAHRPEVCYPAQGFRVQGMTNGRLDTPFGAIPVYRLDTVLGNRSEPVTYWVTLGDEVVQNRLQKRFAEFKRIVTGQVLDGLLFRVSSIDGNSADAFKRQSEFTAELLSAVPPDFRVRLSGLGAQATGDVKVGTAIAE
jgi:EpsI family protein